MTARDPNEPDPQAFPLFWPNGWPRVQQEQRGWSRFKVSRTEAVEDILKSLRIMGCKEIVISTNVKPTREGTPMASAAEPKDPGVAVYWTRKGQPGCMACDKYRTLRENIRAISQALDGLRAIERSGASQVLDRIFTGLKALPANIVPARSWRDVLGIAPGAMPTPGEIGEVFTALARERHPDRGGTHEQFVELTTAREEALREISWSKK